MTNKSNWLQSDHYETMSYKENFSPSQFLVVSDVFSDLLEIFLVIEAPPNFIFIYYCSFSWNNISQSNIQAGMFRLFLTKVMQNWSPQSSLL